MGTIIKATIEDKEQELEVLGQGMDAPRHATHFLGQTGNLWRITHRDTYATITMFLRLIHPQHEFGGVVYEETGEVDSQRESGH